MKYFEICDEDKLVLSEIDHLNNVNPSDESGPIYWKPARRPGFLKKVRVKGPRPPRPDWNESAMAEAVEEGEVTEES